MLPSLELISGVLCITSLPEDYRDASVYNKTCHAAARMVYGGRLGGR
jgi:hypothetical protein